MKIVKIGAIWCGACLVMNKVWSDIKKNYNFEYLEYDYDFDSEEVKKYNPGKILPVFIVYDSEDNELFRFCGEVSYKEFSLKLEEVGGNSE